MASFKIISSKHRVTAHLLECQDHDNDHTNESFSRECYGQPWATGRIEGVVKRIFGGEAIRDLRIIDVETMRGGLWGGTPSSLWGYQHFWRHPGSVIFFSWQLEVALCSSLTGPICENHPLTWLFDEMTGIASDVVGESSR